MCCLVLLKWHFRNCYFQKLEACKRKKDHVSCHKPCYLRLHRWSKCILFFHFISVTATGRMTTLGLAFYQILGMATLTSLLGVSLMAVERAVCVKKPHTWTQILPLKRILQIMTGNWVFIPGSLLHSYHRDFIRIRQYVYQNPEVNQCNW